MNVSQAIETYHALSSDYKPISVLGGAVGTGAGIRTRKDLRPNACETFASTISM
jgi:hypothetical protein